MMVIEALSIEALSYSLEPEFRFGILTVTGNNPTFKEIEGPEIKGPEIKGPEN
jgi:hypothetical protein